MKKTALCLAALMVVLSLSACSDTQKNDNLFAENNMSTTENITANLNEELDENNVTKEEIIFKNDNVIVTECVPPEETIYVDKIWMATDEDKLYDESEVIADVTVKSLEEIGISYTLMGAECTTYKTLATVSVNEIFYSADDDIKQEFTIAIPNSSYTFTEDFPEVAIGERYILFISNTNELNDSLELSNYCDYYLSLPANIININGLECNTDEIFSNYSSNTTPITKGGLPNIEAYSENDYVPEEYFAESDGIPTGRCSMPLSDFKNELISKINERNKE